MSIDNLTFGELKQIAALFGNQPATESISGNARSIPTPQGLNAMVGKKCIVRTYSAGVWFGTVSEKSGDEVIVTNARRMWRWWAAESISLSAVAIHGIKQSDSKIAAPVESVWLQAIELIPATDKAISSIEGAPNVEAQ